VGCVVDHEVDRTVELSGHDPVERVGVGLVHAVVGHHRRAEPLVVDEALERLARSGVVVEGDERARCRELGDGRRPAAVADAELDRVPVGLAIERNVLR
jgi:hypothetical protein